ncbi:MAG TPA: DNA translocase FtsK, partial [Bacillota bacterium]
DVEDRPPRPYRLPPLTLLHRGKPRRQGAQSRKEIEARARHLEATLENFGVKARVVGVQEGPAVTRFELEPATGVRVSKIQSLANDIALSMAATDVRIEAPIPGKSLVGIEVPNREIAAVYLRDVIDTPEFRDNPSRLALALGRDIAGQPVVTSLEKMVHVLIAGATGSGKSVCVNAMLGSLLFKAKPDEVRLLLIDPKVVELNLYNGIPHLLVPVVTEPKRAAAALAWAVREMERRYERFADTGVRDIGRYNARADQEGTERLPYIVVVIDELADLMMVAPVDVEDAIQRLAQMARAAGIHLVVATQRPSVDVITGVIKANIPSRIAFAVSSQTDSRVILDMAGAEKLVGKGDMLFHPMGAAKPIRVQGAYLSENELEEVLAFVREQGRPVYHEEVLASTDRGEAESLEGDDDLFPEAVRLVVEAGQASVSLLQRRLRVGYTRAGRLIDMMEERGFVGPHQGSKPRDVRLTMEEYRRIFGTGSE